MTDLPAFRAEPRSGFRFRVGVAIADTALRASLAAAIYAVGAVALALQDAQLRDVGSAKRIQALALQLGGGLGSALTARLGEIADQFTYAPIIAYVRSPLVAFPGWPSDDILARRVRIVPISTEESQIRRHAGWLTRAISPCVLSRIMIFLRPEMSLLARSYVAEYLWQLALGAESSTDQRRRRNLQTTAEALAVTRRALEKALATSGSPQPKELSDWLTLLLVSHTARGLGRLSHHIAAEYGLSRHQWSRLRTRRLTSYPGFPDLPAYGQCDVALTVFSHRCGIPRRRIASALRMAL